MSELAWRFGVPVALSAGVSLAFASRLRYRLDAESVSAYVASRSDWAFAKSPAFVPALAWVAPVVRATAAAPVLFLGLLAAVVFAEYASPLAGLVTVALGLGAGLAALAALRWRAGRWRASGAVRRCAAAAAAALLVAAVAGALLPRPVSYASLTAALVPLAAAPAALAAYGALPPRPAAALVAALHAAHAGGVWATGGAAGGAAVSAAALVTDAAMAAHIGRDARRSPRAAVLVALACRAAVAGAGPGRGLPYAVVASYAAAGSLLAARRDRVPLLPYSAAAAASGVAAWLAGGESGAAAATAVALVLVAGVWARGRAGAVAYAACAGAGAYLLAEPLWAGSAVLAYATAVPLAVYAGRSWLAARKRAAAGAASAAAVLVAAHSAYVGLAGHADADAAAMAAAAAAAAALGAVGALQLRAGGPAAPLPGAAIAAAASFAVLAALAAVRVPAAGAAMLGAEAVGLALLAGHRAFVKAGRSVPPRARRAAAAAAAAAAVAGASVAIAVGPFAGFTVAWGALSVALLARALASPAPRTLYGALVLPAFAHSGDGADDAGLADASAPAAAALGFQAAAVAWCVAFALASDHPVAGIAAACCAAALSAAWAGDAGWRARASLPAAEADAGTGTGVAEADSGSTGSGTDSEEDHDDFAVQVYAQMSRVRRLLARARAARTSADLARARRELVAALRRLVGNEILWEYAGDWRAYESDHVCGGCADAAGEFRRRGERAPLHPFVFNRVTGESEWLKRGGCPAPVDADRLVREALLGLARLDECLSEAYWRESERAARALAVTSAS